MTEASKYGITLEKLRSRAAKGDLTQREIRAYFEPDERRGEAFAPAFKLTEFVDKQGKRPSARTVTELYFGAEMGVVSGPRARLRPRSRGRGITTTASAARMKVLAEGDSWFRLPNLSWPVSYPDDLVDVLRQTYEIPGVAMWGAEIGHMVTVQKNNYLVPLRSGLYRHFMFSGGGNDVLASVQTHVKRFGAAGTNPSSAESYLKASFDGALATVIGHYRTLAGHVRSVSNPKPTLYVHGYAHARPLPGGPYIGAKLEALGFDANSSLARKIVAAMVDRFNVKLKAFAAAENAAHPTYKVVYVNLRPAFTSAADWNTDEIHPSDAGAAKAAARMGDNIAANVPVA
ncbi:SGNH/GDSL hydrolase family protein [Mesorhizobium sp. KR9-304]|uniref:SGNH/GDSL hydrolase family protein n=1 Tax=Mesorhizobium sp. KR9-304 TaxID=3156614 RepID=UPI0032B5DC7C